MVEAARKYSRIVQYGTQCRSSPKIREGIEKLKAGVIGRVYMARGVVFKIRAGGRNKFGPVPKGMHWDLWLGPAPVAPYNQLAVGRWRFLKDYGNGEIGDQGVHQLDIIRWGLGLRHASQQGPVDGRQPGPRRRRGHARRTRSSPASTTAARLLVAGRDPRVVHQLRGRHGDRVSLRRSPQRGGRDLPRHAKAT